MSDGIWHLEALSDSDFANDKETRISVYGYIVYYCGVPIAWKSKSMKSVVLSTTEAEYVAVSEVVKEIKFLYQLLMSMGTMVLLLIKIKVDNVFAIWLAKNSGVSERSDTFYTKTPIAPCYCQMMDGLNTQRGNQDNSIQQSNKSWKILTGRPFKGF